MCSTARPIATRRGSKSWLRERSRPCCTTGGFRNGGRRLRIGQATASLEGGPVTKHVWFAVLILVFAAPLDAQSLLYRPANLGGTWVVDPGVVQFNFVHRFYVAPGPSHTVVNDPTFTFATGIARNVAVGAQFATHSFIIEGFTGSQSSNETQLFARWRAWGGPEGSEGFHVSVTPAYNFLAKSGDGELGADWTKGALTLEGAARIAGKPLGQSSARAAFGGGFVARVNRYVPLSADVGSFLSPTLLAAWGAALNGS